MPSPFPGMDPFLEDHWGDVHTSLSTYARDQIRPQLPTDLRVRVEEYVGLEIEEEGHNSEETRQKPDVLISEPWSPAGTQTSTAVMEPIVSDDQGRADQPAATVAHQRLREAHGQERTVLMASRRAVVCHFALLREFSVKVLSFAAGPVVGLDQIRHRAA